MKKVFLSLLLAAGLTSLSHAQGLQVGVKAGANLTNVRGDNDGGREAKVGFHGGILANYAFNETFSIQPEVLYSMQGHKFKDLADDVRVNLNYIQVPVLFRVHAEGLFFEAGPQLGFRIKSEVRSDAGSISYDSLIKPLDFNYAAGLGYQSSSGPIVGLRYTGSFSTISENIGIFAGDDSRNQVFQLYAGFLFGSK